MRGSRLVANIFDGVAGEPGGAVDGAGDWREGGAVRSSSLRQAVGQQPRGGQHVAQIVVDLVGRRADLGEARFLAQRGAQLALQVLNSRSTTPISSLRRLVGARSAPALPARGGTVMADRQILQRQDHRPARPK